MEDEIIKDGKKYKLVPVVDEKVLDEFSPVPSQATFRDNSNPTPLPTDVLLVKPDIEVKTGKEMMMTTAKRLTEARVNKAIEESQIDSKFNKRFGSSRSSNFYGPGVQSGRAGTDEEEI